MSDKPKGQPDDIKAVKKAPYTVFGMVEELYAKTQELMDNENTDAFPEVVEAMGEILKMAELMKEQEKLIRQEFGITEETFQQALASNKTEMDPKTERFVKQIEKLKKEITDQKDQIESELSKSRSPKKKSKKKGREHKRKFRGLGGDDWVPM